MIQSQRWCLSCEDYTLHAKQSLSSGMGCLLLTISCLFIIPFGVLLMTLVLGPLGFFLGILASPAYVFLFVLALAGLGLLVSLMVPWRCQRCGASGNPAYQPFPRRPSASATNRLADSELGRALVEDQKIAGHRRSEHSHWLERGRDQLLSNARVGSTNRLGPGLVDARRVGCDWDLDGDSALTRIESSTGLAARSEPPPTRLAHARNNLYASYATYAI